MTHESRDRRRARGWRASRRHTWNRAEFRDCSQIIARAFSSLDQFVKLVGPLLAPGGELLAMKGAYPEAEVAQLPKGWRVSEVHHLQVPFVEGERCLVVIKRK